MSITDGTDQDLRFLQWSMECRRIVEELSPVQQEEIARHYLQEYLGFDTEYVGKLSAGQLSPLEERLIAIKMEEEMNDAWDNGARGKPNQYAFWKRLGPVLGLTAGGIALFANSHDNYSSALIAACFKDARGREFAGAPLLSGIDRATMAYVKEVMRSEIQEMAEQVLEVVEDILDDLTLENYSGNDS